MAKAKTTKPAKTEETPVEKRKLKINKLYAVIAVLLVVIAAGGYVAYDRYDNQQKEIKRLSDPQEAAKTEADRIKQEIGELIEVPQDEAPTIATVVDPSKLGNQAFFAKAEKDDRVVIYAKAKKAILYRPSSKKIVEVAPLNIGDTNTPSGATTPATTPDPAATTQTP